MSALDGRASAGGGSGGHARGSGGGRGDGSDEDEDAAFGAAVVALPAADDGGSSDAHESGESYCGEGDEAGSRRRVRPRRAAAAALAADDEEARAIAAAAAAYAAASTARGAHAPPAAAAAGPAGVGEGRFHVSEDTTVYGHLQAPPVDASDGEAPPPTLFGVSLRRPRLINRLVTRRHITHPKPTE